MKPEKNQILQILNCKSIKKNVRFNELFNLLRNTPGANSNQLNSINRAGFSESNLATVEYELKKLHNISAKDIKDFEKVDIPLNQTFLQKFLIALTLLDKDIANKLLVILKFRFEFPLTEQWEKASDELKDYLSDEIPVNSIVSVFPEFSESKIGGADLDYIEYLQAVEYPEAFKSEFENLKITLSSKDMIFVDESETIVELRKVISEASPEVKTEIKFRDEFPFLTADDCPQELKALVTDKFGHYHKFCEDHAELFDKVVRPYIEGKKAYETEEQITNDIIFGIAKSIVENFVGDQAIYDELLHYRETKTILGQHPIFKKEDLTANPFANLTPAELAKKKSNLENYVRRETNASEKAKNDEDKKKFSDKAKAFQSQLDAVNEILNAKQ